MLPTTAQHPRRTVKRVTAQFSPNHFLHFDDGRETEIESRLMPLPQIGSGYIDGDGHRYRIVDVWLSHDHHGHHNDGYHVWLDDVSHSPDDRPGLDQPSYYDYRGD